MTGTLISGIASILIFMVIGAMKQGKSIFS